LNHFTVPVATFRTPWKNNSCSRAAKRPLGKQNPPAGTGGHAATGPDRRLVELGPKAKTKP
jgi:hypothetical protein